MTTADHPRHLRLMETFHNLFYTPIYVTVGGGFLDQQGIDVRFKLFVDYTWRHQQIEP